MEGFRYRINNTDFPVFHKNVKLSKFPILPVGMLDIWRSEDPFGFWSYSIISMNDIDVIIYC